MSPPFIVQIDEIGSQPAVNDNRASWVPSLEREDITVIASRTFWFCDGDRLYESGESHPPKDSVFYSTWSMFFVGGYGFWVMRGDAKNPSPGETWQPLTFDYDINDNYSSILTNVGQHGTLCCRPERRGWPDMLLPDIYHGARTADERYGGLKGELGIFLGLIAFSIKRVDLTRMLPLMFRHSRWQLHDQLIDREGQRGVVVRVYTAPSTLANGSTVADLDALQAGSRFGKYFTGNPGPAPY